MEDGTELSTRHEAFAEYVFPEIEVLYGAARSLTGQPADAQDLVFDSVVERAFTALPEKYRRVVALVDVEGFSYTEAAAVLDVPVGTVMSRLHRARHRIRRQLAAEGVTPKRGVG